MLIIVLLLPIIVSLCFYLVPAYLARQKRYDNPAESYVATRSTEASIFTNAAIAYALQMATFGPFFVWGATADYWPAIINSAFFFGGLLILIMARRPILEFIEQSMRGTGSITLHGFMAAAHGNARMVRIVTSILTVIALWGIVIAEMFGTMAVLSPLLGGSREASFMLVAAMFFFMFLYTTTGGNSGVQRADQFQLGVAYLSLFLILAAVIWLAARQMPIPSAIYLPAILGLICLVVLFARRRFRFIDYSVPSVADEDLAGDQRMQRLARIYKVMERVLNWFVVFGVASAGVSCLVILVGAQFAALPNHITAPLLNPSLTSPIALVALAILPLAYQICDLSNWQRIAALRPDLVGANDKPQAAASAKAALWGYAIEAPTTWLILMLLGAVVAASFTGLDLADPVGSFTQLLIAQGTFGLALLSLLVVAVFAISLSTMDAVLSATLFAFRYDIIFDRERDDRDDVQEPRRVRLVNLFGFLTYAVVVFGLFLESQYIKAFGGQEYLTLLLAVYSAQISFLPLIIGGIWGRKDPGGVWNVGPTGAICTLVAGFGSALSLTVYGMVSGNVDAPWAAVPACVITSIAIYLAFVCYRAVRRWRLAFNKRGK